MSETANVQRARVFGVLVMVMVSAVLCVSMGLAAEPMADGLKSLPANRWTRLPEVPPELEYRYNNVVYDPIRKQLVLYTPKGVAAFDVGKANWVMDYDAYPGKASPPVPGLGSGGNDGVSWRGIGRLLSSGHPAPSYTAFGTCWDSKRKQMVLVMRGLMAVYDSQAKKWTELNAKTVLYDKEYPGGPPVYNVGVCYDPINDEILMQPHFGTWDDWAADFPPILNRDRLEVDGRVSTHLGTFRFSFTDNTWRRVGDTFGNTETKAARKAVLELTAAVSRATDQAWALRRRPDAFDPAKVKSALAGALQTAEALAGKLPAEAREAFGRVLAPLKAASEAAAAGKWEEAMKAGNKAWWELDTVLDRPLRVEPQARCAAPMLYDPKRQAIVLHGGRAGEGMLNDTWLYDCKTRQWRELSCKTRPETQGPGGTHIKSFVDPASGLFFTITQKEQNYGRTIPAMATLWSMDIEKGEWFKRHEGVSPAEEWPGLYDPSANVAYDPERRLLIFTHLNGGRPKPVYETFAMRLDLASLPSAPAPEWRDQSVQPHVLPLDDLGWVTKLKSLPANEWQIPWKKGPASRDYGTMGYDPVRGHPYYFGGGHSTYQWNDVAIYQPGANQWVSGVGEHNDFFLPGVHWGGVTMSFRGGKPATHCMQNYDACDGRMYFSNGVIGGGERLSSYVEYGKSPEWRYAWFYDMDRGGVWRWQKATDVQLGAGVDGAYGYMMFADPAGRIFGMTTSMRQDKGNDYFSTLDIYTGKLRVNKVPQPRWPGLGEGKQFCYVESLKKVFLFAGGPGGTYLYDPDSNKVEKLRPEFEPGKNDKPEWGAEFKVSLLVPLEGHDAVYAVIGASKYGRGEEWVYSFKHNTWARLKTNKPAFDTHGPFGQIAYVAKYGVLVSTRDGIMRPDMSGVKWDKAPEPTNVEAITP